MIVCITGGPGTGKSFHAAKLALMTGARLVRSDDLSDRGWSEASQAIAAELLTARADLVVEGVAVPRALRKALDQGDGKPCDRLIVLRTRRPEAGPEIAGQVSMRKGLETVLREIWDDLIDRGVEIVDANGVRMREL